MPLSLLPISERLFQRISIELTLQFLKMSKQILAIFFILFVVSGLRKEVEDHLWYEYSEDDDHELENHEQLLDMTAKAAEFTENIKGMFTLTCDKGYARGVNVFIKNKIPGVILTLRGIYQNRGKILERGQYELAPNTFTSWYFSKMDYSTYGSNGLNIWQIGNTNKGIIIFYENPMNSWNFQGLCIRDGIPFPSNNRKIPDTYLQDLFLKMQNGFPVWPKDCVLLDNTKDQNTDWRKEKTILLGGYKVFIRGQYKSLDGCYTSSITTLIST